MTRYICIHGHFYQPPRENPWLEAVELQDSAHPFHDWNERICEECYAPNGMSRMLDGQGRIWKMVNNYARMSFNFGPTLLSWMEEKSPETYGQILEADRESRELFGGHGSAIAQAYNHMIMPLANSRDKTTQVVWGIADFEARFGRSPEGMWLPETAVDLESLELLAAQGITFTILAPRQARRIRRLGARTWKDVSGSRIDPSMPYVIRLPSRRRMVLFFYDGPVSQAVAFEHLLSSGERFGHRLLSLLDGDSPSPQLAHIATDGETYGHHQKFGEMALSYAMHLIEESGVARLTNYGQFLELHDPTHEVQIHENSSWSCVHGVERWRSDCGCNSGGNGDWNQEWRGPLRAALDWLRDRCEPLFEEEAGRMLHKPWAARDDYISVVLDRSRENVDRFMERHGKKSIESADAQRVLKLMELQRHLMLMYTSCGWFFDELSGLETVQVQMYAGRAIQLAEDLFETRIEPDYVSRVELARSNLREHQNGGKIYEKWVRPCRVDLLEVGAHYAVGSLFETYRSHDRIYAFDVESEAPQSHSVGRAKLVTGRISVTSRLTGVRSHQTFAALHLGGHHVRCGLRASLDDQAAYDEMVEAIGGAFKRAAYDEAFRLLDNRFNGAIYSIRSLFRDEQRRVLETVVDGTLEGTYANYRQVYETHAPLMAVLKELDVPQPKALRDAAGLVLNFDLRHAFDADTARADRITALMSEIEGHSVPLEEAALARKIELSLFKMLQSLSQEPGNLELLERLHDIASVAVRLPVGFNLWRIQNLFYEMTRRTYPFFVVQATEGNDAAERWIDRFSSLGTSLKVRIE